MINSKVMIYDLYGALFTYTTNVIKYYGYKNGLALRTIFSQYSARSVLTQKYSDAGFRVDFPASLHV